MSIYETVKGSINLREAAERYGVGFNYSGMALCPFHNDHHPSLLLEDDHYYASRSEADAALCALLAFYTKDAEQLDRLFRSSGLMRPKWDRPQSGTTYGKITLANAIGHCRGGYDPQAYFRRMVDQYVREE
jgi:putative DNA primase/helicase